MLECVAVEELHGDELLVAFTANFIDRANVGMIQGGRSLCFALETRERLWISGYIARKKLQRNEAPQGGVFGLVHHTHASAAEFFQYAIMRNLFDGITLHASELYLRADKRVNGRGRRPENQPPQGIAAVSVSAARDV